MVETETTLQSAQRAGLGARLAVFIYSLLAYGLGVVALLWLIAYAAGLAPVQMAPFYLESATARIVMNLVLIGLFGVQHSVMARRGFKQWLTRVIPEAAERSTYVLAAAIMLALVLWLWQPLAMSVWRVTHPAGALALWALFAFGWLYLFAATYATNHYDLFGLRQAWLYLRKRPYTPVPFVRNWMYRYSRHPMMVGIVIGLWATPQMSAGHLVLAVGFTIYIAVGVLFEERELAHHFGEDYERYREEVGVLAPRTRA